MPRYWVRRTSMVGLVIMFWVDTCHLSTWTLRAAARLKRPSGALGARIWEFLFLTSFLLDLGVGVCTWVCEVRDNNHLWVPGPPKYPKEWTTYLCWANCTLDP